MNFQWTQIEQKGDIPSPRSGHTITTVGKFNLLFGGLDNQKIKNGKLTSSNELFSLRIVNKSCQWQKINSKGDVPLPRSGHAACAIGQDKLFIFGGYYTSNLRFNDAFFYRTNDLTWIQPPNQKSGEPKNAESKIGAPEPRANHTAIYHKGKVYIFGGHGGVGYTRQAFNDIYALDVETSEWTNLEPEGNLPLPRGGHTASLLSDRDCIIVYGGWSNSSQYSDVWCYNIESNVWIDPELSHEIPRWYHTGIMVPAIPKWKYFVFGGSTGNFEDGGNRTVSKMSDDIYYLDVENEKMMNWYNIKIEGEKPKVREQSTMFYDQNESRVIIFGGWAQNWLGDMHALKVNMITGPPYAIFSMEPKMGPLTGKTKIIITGDGFRETSIIVRFDAGYKTSPEVMGIFIDEKTIECETPSFENVGQPNKATVTISQNKGDYSITSAEFDYYYNTKAEHCIAIGPGILQENSTEAETCFIIQAKDLKGMNRVSGSDQFEVSISYRLSEEAEEVVLENRIEDMENGQYKVFYVCKEEVQGTKIEICYKDDNNKLEPIRGSPYSSSFSSLNDKKNNDIKGGYLQNQAIKELTDTEINIAESKSAINIKNKDKDLSDVEVLLSVKANLQRINQTKEEIFLKLDIIEQTLLTLANEHGDPNRNSAELKKAVKLREDWGNLQKMANAVEKDIATNIRAEADKAKDNLQKFEDQLKDYLNVLKKESVFQYKTGFEVATERLQAIENQLTTFDERLTAFDYSSKMFSFPDAIIGSTKNLEQIKIEISLITKLWDHIKVCQEKFESYQSLKYYLLDPTEMDDEVKRLRKSLLDIKGLDRKVNTYFGINEDIKKWSTFIPLLAELKDKAMEEMTEVEKDGQTVKIKRHWEKVKQIVNQDFVVDEGLQLSTIWDLKLFEYKDAIEDVADQAKNELKMEVGLSKIIEIWKNVEFECMKHKDTDIQTLKMNEDNFETLEEHQMLINNMLLSKYIGYFEKAVEKWKSDLGSVYDVIQCLIDVQKTWSFLENLFIGSEEVKKELPNESKQFVQIDIDMKQIMKTGVQTINILQFCTQPGMLKKLENIEKELKVCEKALNSFLDEKRIAFPRFYFVSVADLLDILSNGNTPEKINKHMSKIYQSIEKLKLKMGGQGERPTAELMISCVGKEDVAFETPLKLIGKVEIYLQSIIDNMRSSIKSIVLDASDQFEKKSRDDWIKKYPSQVCLLVNIMVWCSKVEEAFRKIVNEGKLEAMKECLKDGIQSLTNLIKMVQGDLDKETRQKVMVLITMDTHSRDIMDKLIVEDVRKSDAFQWQSQLKFYWDTNSKGEKDSACKIADAKIFYSYEYLGNGARLVITPLTDRIYVTATQALHLSMGCAPAGPAGTGKTESTKDLANALAVACYVFNCSSEMNYESMGNIFKGLASSGCWGCFDEFNRLLPEVLSVCSVQFKSVTDGIKNKSKRIVIEGDEISLVPSCGVYITMNPGYLGRAELPEGLKALFRPITVVVPDLELICENMLMAEGFIDAKVLAHKFVTLYFLCRDLLSKAMHYDWGLRAIKSVLVVAGGFKRAEPDILEAALLMRALRDFNIPKIVAADNDIFFGLLADLFPGVNPPRKRDMDFEQIIEKTCEDQGFFKEPEFIIKIVQLKELLEIRHCVFVMGPPGSGKTSTWVTLAKSFDKAGSKTMLVDLDPKVVQTRDLYGYTLPSKEWKDGLLSKLLRTYSEMEDTNTKWLCLDGDLDANWIESMNSVMDDNKILTLANNERIPLKPHMRMIFEIRDLNFATPATVSRAGILYISDDSGHQWQSYIKSFIKKNWSASNEQETAISIQKLFDRYVAHTLLYLKKSCRTVIPVTQIAMVISLCRALKPLLENDCKNIEYIFVYTLIWSIGGILTEKDGIDFRKEFSNWWKAEWKTSVKFPAKGTVFDYYVDQSEDSYKFEEWSKKVQTFDFDTTLGHQMSQITVQTRETVATAEFLKTFLLVQHPVLLIGNAGCGKTMLAKGVLKEITTKYPENYTFQNIQFNFYTDSANLQAMLEQQLEKKAGRQYGPTGKMKLIYYIDDLNMPQLDPYNTQNSIALLRQHADYQHWYDIAKLSIKDIANCQHMASMNPSAGSFYVNPRYQRHFWVVSIPFPDNESLFQIYQTFLGGHLKQFKPSLQEQGTAIIKAALQLHQSIVVTFRKTAINFHYEFNIRHLANIFQGLLLTQPTQFQEPDKLVRLWIHESERTYGDRLVNLEHLAQYKAIMFDLLKKQFARYNFAKFFQASAPESLVFSNFCAGMAGERNYDQMADNKLFFYLDESLKEYNDNNPVMGLVLFEDAMKHICRISRIILPPSGHALLVGVGGSGKQSLAKLSAFIMGMICYSITISSSYGVNDLKEDLKMLYNKCGIKDEQYLFLFTEGQITKENFLVYINDLLSSGEIADLYTNDDKELIINNVRAKVKGEGIPDTRDNCWTYFIDKVKKNLHMALCFSPVGDFRIRARKFPGLVNCTVIDWFHPWPQDALYSVADNFLKEVELGSDDIKKSIVSFMPFSFKTVNDLSIKILEQDKRYVYTTPKTFLELIKLYVNMLTSKRTELENNKERYENGLIKLNETAEQVSIIEVDVKLKGEEAEIKKNQADAFAEIVGAEKAIVEVENAKATIEQENCAKIKMDVEQKKTSTQADLDAAGPLVEQALAALNTIKKQDLQQMKTYTSPPLGFDGIFLSVMYLMAGHWNDNIEVDKNKKPKTPDWKACLKMMKSPEEFMKRLMDFKDIVDKNMVVPQNVHTVKSLYLNQEYFTVEIMSIKSAAVGGVTSWVLNIVKYWEVIQQVEPKRKQLKEAEDQLDEANIKLGIVEEQVAELNAKLFKLQSEFDNAINEKNQALETASKCRSRLNLAQRLVSALGSEKDRWEKSIEALTQQINVVAGDVLLSSAFISYAGPFSKKFRSNMIQGTFTKFMNDQKIPMTKNIDVIKILSNDALIATWNMQGLPSDQVSIENGTILTNSERYPLMIDPQLQGITWIRIKEKDNFLKQVRLGSKNIMRDMELSIENGYSCIIENMDEKVDAIIMPVISRSFIKKGRRRILKLGNKDLTLHDNFKLFMQTKLSNPHYPPEIQAEATLINFTVTEEGLGDQLLSLVVERERLDLSKKKIELITQQNDFKIKLKQLEDDLLFRLANVQGDILENIELIENLEYSKKLSTEISIKVEIAKKTEIKINQASEFYRPAASRGALFYFLLTDLAKIHSFYKYSLDAFIVVIHRAIDAISETKMADKLALKEGDAEQKDDDEEVVQEKTEKTDEPLVEKQIEEKVEIAVDEVKEETEQKDENGEIIEKKKTEENQEEGGDDVVVDEKNEAKESQEVENGEGEDESKKEKQPLTVNTKKDQNSDDIMEDPLSPRSLSKRVEELIESITITSFNNTRRGLFERHKLIVAAMLTLRIQVRQGLPESQVNHLILGKVEQNAPMMPDVLKNFITEQIWSACKALESIQEFSSLSLSLDQDALQWRKWYNEEKAEIADLPKTFKELKKFHRLLLLRAMRPDRLSSALGIYIEDIMGKDYVDQQSFSMEQTYLETNRMTAIMFVLFPGVDPTPDVEQMGEKLGFTSAKGTFINISMGQGQENGARIALFDAAKKGTWIMLQNLHLMQNWLYGLNGLEGFMEQVNANAHPNFRCFFSSEPPPLSDQVIIPESILQSCLKVANEAPQDLKANLRRAYSKFNDDFIQKCPETKRNEFKAILFGTCFFHAIVLGRKKFGSQGWSRGYNFNDGDLTICADVLYNYLSKYEIVPYDDLRYMYGEIMYGGHITDNWDRRTCGAYLKVIIRSKLMEGVNLGPGFKSPDPNKFQYATYKEFIETKLPVESPLMFGMHPNAEIGYLTQQCDMIFSTILEVQGGAATGGSKKDTGALEMITNLKNRAPADYAIFDITLKIKEKTPYIVVALQEVERMNILLQEIKQSLEELKLGLTGALNITDAMESLQQSLTVNKVPANWEKVAYFSRKPLGLWFQDMIDRCTQLTNWTSELITPNSLCISYLFNPMSYLTAIMQNTARTEMLPLDDMILQTDVTQIRNHEDIQQFALNGAYIHGLYLEGAAWDIGSQGQPGYLIDQKIKELHPKLPIVNVIAVKSQDKKMTGQYECPVYVTSLRGPTMVFTANLQMESEDSEQSKWILSGTCILMSDD